MMAASRDILRSIAETSSALLAALDTSFRFIAFNRAFQKEFFQVFGARVELGMDVRDALSHLPTERANVEAVWQRALRGEPYTTVLPFGSEHLSRKVYEIEFRPLKNEAGELLGAFQIARDVTERQQLDEEVRRLRLELEQLRQERAAHTREAPLALEPERLQALNTLERITDAFFALDRDWRFTYFNREAERLLRRPREELLGRNVWAQFQDAETFRFHYERALSEQRTTTFEGFYAPLSAWFEVRAYPSPDGLSVFFRDISERKRAEQVLRESEQFLRSVLDSLSAHIAVLDEKGLVLAVNEAWKRFAASNGLSAGTCTDCHCGVGADYLAETDAAAARGLEEARAAAQGIRDVIAGRREGFELEYACHSPALQRWFILRVSRFVGPGPMRVVVTHEDITSRKTAEEAIRRLTREEAAREEAEVARARLHGVLERITDGFIAYDQQWRFTYVNRHAEEYFGRKREELLGRSVWEVFPESVGTRVHSLLHQATDTQQPLEAEVPSAISDRWIRMVAYPSREGISLYFRDVTAQRRTQEALRHSEAKLRGIVSLAADAIIAVDEQRRIRLFNEGARHIFGYAPEEVLGQPLEVLLPEAVRAVHERHVQDFAASPEVASRRMGARLCVGGRRKSGEEFPAEVSITRLELGNERVFAAVLRDVTEQRRAEEREHFLSEVGATLARTLDYESTLQAIVRLAVPELAQGCALVVERGPTEGRALGVAAEKPELESFLREVLAQPAALAGPVGGALEQALRTGEPVLLPGGRTLAMPLRTRERTSGVLVLVRVESSRPYAAEDLAVARELALRATLALENARLYLAAQQAIATRDETLGIVSHDLRSPLSAISLLSSTIEMYQIPQGNEGQRARDSLRRIRQSVGDMNRLIEDLLAVAKMEAGRLSLDVDSVEVTPLLSQTVELLEPLAGAKALRLEATCEAGLPRVRADRARVLQVFQNLVGNALKFTPAGGRIHLHAELEGKCVRFSISDTGQGIEPEALPHVFDRFWQARHARHAGAGLGLAIVKGIVEAHGGTIQVASKPGLGTTFSFTLPTG